MARQDRKTIIEKIEKHRHSRVICCLTSDRPNAQGVIAKDFIPIFFNHLRNLATHDRIDTFLFTMGGDTLAAFGLSRLLREFTQSVGSVGTLVPEKCHSGGTLFALGANEICMTRVATLSPIDPSVSTALNPTAEVAPGQRQFIPVSVESVAGFRALVEEWNLKDEAVGAAFQILAQNINPLALGDVYRSREQIARLARTLLESHNKNEEKIQKTVKTLTTGLGSHDYLISRTEAREMLGEQVLPDDRALEDLMWALLTDFQVEMELGKPYDPSMAWNAMPVATRTAPVRIKLKLVAIESLADADVWERELQLSPVQVMSPQGPLQTLRQEVIQNSWTHYA